MATSRAADASYPIRAVDRVCDLLDALQRSPDGVTLTALAESVSLPKSSALRYLSVLESRRYVERDDQDSTYRLGLAFRPERGDYLSALRDAALPHLLKLRDRFGETVNLGVLDGWEVLHVEVAESTRPVRLAARRGERAPLHSTAIGKVIATELPSTRLQEILDESRMPTVTDKTITKPDDFLVEIKQTARRGYGLDDCENQVDGRCVAVLLKGLAVPAAVSVSAPASRFAPEDVPRVAQQLRRQLPGLASALRAVSV